MSEDISSAAVQCGNLGSLLNGQVNVDGNTFGSQANYSCSEGYVLNGNSTRMCQSDGQWSGSESTCEGQNLLCVCIMMIELGYMCLHACVSVDVCMSEYGLFSIAVPCGTLNNPTNGQVNVEGNTFGSQANYSCSEGYVLNGNSTRMCQSDGQWSGSEPTCEGQNGSVCDVCF